MFVSSSIIRSCISWVLLSFINFSSVSSSSCSRSSRVTSTVTFSLSLSSSCLFKRIRSSYSDWISFFCSSSNSSWFLSSNSVRQRSSTMSLISFLREFTTSSHECSICVIWWEVASIRLTALASCDCNFMTYCESTFPPFGATLLMSSAYSRMASLFCMSFSSTVRRSSTALVWRLRRSTSIRCSIDSFICSKRSSSNSFCRLSSSCCFSCRSFSNPDMFASFARTSLSSSPRSPSSFSVRISGSSPFAADDGVTGALGASSVASMERAAVSVVIDSVVVSSAMLNYTIIFRMIGLGDD
mmetsp:Transcript_17626/g.36339  ORF Transcript_17626/g.36339 Transcript_17626/m.36339 type:complete len:299 (+) Transcript_17626:3721-4617(+)